MIKQLDGPIHFWREKMDEMIKLDVIKKDGDSVIRELEKGNIVVARSKNDFLYILEEGKAYHMFSHNPSSPKGGKKSFPKDEKYTAIIKSFAQMADAMFLVEYDKSLNLFSVLASAEEGILSMYPGNDSDDDATVEFIIPEI